MPLVVSLQGMKGRKGRRGRGGRRMGGGPRGGSTSGGGRTPYNKVSTVVLVTLRGVQLRNSVIIIIML